MIHLSSFAPVDETSRQFLYPKAFESSWTREDSFWRRRHCSCLGFSRADLWLQHKIWCRTMHSSLDLVAIWLARDIGTLFFVNHQLWTLAFCMWTGHIVSHDAIWARWLTWCSCDRTMGLEILSFGDLSLIEVSSAMVDTLLVYFYVGRHLLWRSGLYFIWCYSTSWEVLSICSDDWDIWSLSLLWLWYLVFLQHMVIQWFHRLYYALWKLCDIEQNILLSFSFWEADTCFGGPRWFWRTNGRFETVFVNQNIFVQTIFEIYFLLERRDLYLFKFGLELEVARTFGSGFATAECVIWGSLELFHQPFRKGWWFWTWNCVSSTDIGSREL